MSKDSKLQKAVLAELNWEPSVNAAHIGVAVDDGFVTLSGHVTRFGERSAAHGAAERVNGVRAVVDDIAVRLAPDAGRSDADIAAAAIDRLAWDASVPQGCIQVAVDQGWVTLTGVVQWHFEKDAAALAVRPLRGVVGLINNISLEAPASVEMISDNITHALGRSWFFDRKQVAVTETEGKVVLTGSVSSLHARQRAAETAWSAAGVTDVQNDIRVV